METSLTVRITPEIKQELNEILTLAGGYFNYKTQHLIDLINGDVKYADVHRETQEIIRRVVLATGHSYDIIKSKTRERQIVCARQFAIWKVYTELYSRCYTLHMIADVFNRDHATVLHSVKVVKGMLKFNDPIFAKINYNYNQIEEDERAAP
jgi:chromosomal replication initiation ATPase DnaA